MKLNSIKILDIPVLLLFIAILTASILMLRKGGADESQLIVRTPEGEFVYPLSKDAVYDIEGAVGTSKIEVLGGKARFLDSPCPGKTCVLSGYLSEPGAWAACLPNEVFIRIEGKKQELDAIAQ
ncbi:MAG: NusG domain II-containing protein [Treponema sp.]|nr:NusG domain II-containing protein [Treponema sp.]